MIEETEVIIFFLSVGMVIFSAVNFNSIREISNSRLLLSAFGCFVLANTVTVLEGLFWGVFLNYTEHIAYLIGSVFLMTWCLKVFYRTRRDG